MLQRFKPQSGYTLFIVLIFIQLFTFAALSQLMQAETAIKSHNQAWLHSKIKWEALSLLVKLEGDVLADILRCKLPITSAVVLIHQPISFWSRVACSGNLSAFRYHYAIEYLGNDPCARIGNQSTERTPDYYRLTLIVLPKKLSSAKIILQSIVAKVSDHALACQAQAHDVYEGRQSFREY